MFSSTFCNEMFSFIFRNQKCGKLEAFSSDCMKHSFKKSRDYLSCKNPVCTTAVKNLVTFSVPLVHVENSFEKISHDFYKFSRYLALS